MSLQQDHSTTFQLFFFALIMVALWHSELIFRSESIKDKWNHGILNFHFLCTAVIVQLPLSIIVLKVSDWTANNSWGIFYHIPFLSNFFLKFIAGLILLDFCEYIYHFTMHKLGFLWKIHLIHHSDTKMDVTTTVREHPAETFIRVGFMVLTVYLMGVPIAILLFRQVIQSFSNILSHTAFSLPNKLDKYLSYILITPGLHKVHHHDQMPYTDSNFGDILSVWDRLFSTYRELEKSKISYGLNNVKENDVVTFSQLLIYPFKKVKSKLIKSGFCPLTKETYEPITETSL